MGFVLLLILGWCVAMCLATIATAYMLTHPPRRTYASALARGQPGDPGELPAPRNFAEFTIRPRGRTLRAWDIQGDLPQGPTIIMLHGWGDSRLGALPRISAFAPHASRLIALDLPGHGSSDGICTLGLSEPLDVHELLAQLPASTPIFLYGWSLGAGVAIAAAASLPREVDATLSLRGVIAESPYRLPRTPASRIMHLRGLPWRVNLRLALAIVGLFQGRGVRWTGFDRAELAARLPPGVPLLVLHGSLDPISPVEDGRAIAAAAHGTFVQLTQGTHHNLWSDESCASECRIAIAAFLHANDRTTTDQTPRVIHT